jgi:hypothetical protein
MAVSADPADSKRLAAVVGHPEERWTALVARVQDDAVTEFSTIQADWLALMWSIDAFRREGIVPEGMGNKRTQPGRRLAAIYRSKGNWYAELLALLLGNRTSQRLAPRSRVEGFSQLHQIDVAWPDRDTKPIQNPLVCLETKVTGAPAYGDTPARGAMSDWSNRRKELKFAATDLKLWRRSSSTVIDHWDEWRLAEQPACYFLWGARLKDGDRIDKMVREVQALTKTYLDGAGIFGWQTNDDESGYIPVSVVTTDQSDRVSTVDDMLRRIASRISRLAPTGTPPPAEQPESRPLDVETLEGDGD